MTSPTVAILALGAAQHLDALHPARAGIVGDLEVGLHLDHRCPTLLLARGRARSGLSAGMPGRALGQNHPALALGDRPAFLDAHDVADLELVGLVMRGVILRPPDELLVDGCMTRRSTRTITVLSPLSLTTVPCRTTPRHSFSPLRPAETRALAQDGLDARDVAAHLAHPRGVLELAGGPLEAQVELLLLQLSELVAELVGASCRADPRPSSSAPPPRPGAPRTGS